MSGLAGIFDFSGAFRENTPLWVSCARRMQARISHRGRDILREYITEHGILLQGDAADAGQIRDKSVFCYEHCAVILDGHLTQKDALCRVLRRNGTPLLFP